jgi:hypothetical protein
MIAGYEAFRISDPEPGQWTVQLYGANVPPAGLDVNVFATDIPDGAEDPEGDGERDASDNCPSVFNISQSDADQDQIGDECDPDYDGDGVVNEVDNCPFTANWTQSDNNGNDIGDDCDPAATDIDEDGVADAFDNCPLAANTDQADSDANGLGDACDESGLPSPSPSPIASPTSPPTNPPGFSPTVTPMPAADVVKGDADCDGQPGQDDLLVILKYLGGLGQVGCVSAADVNCDQGIDGRDALRMLLFVADLPRPAQDGCPAIGSQTA